MNKFVFSFVFTVVLGLGLPIFAYAENALLYLSPPTAVVTIGETFTVNVVIDTGGDLINAAEGRVTYDPADVTLLSVDTSTSIFSSWLTVPVSDGEHVEFSGATDQSGYNGEAGVIMRLTFRALRNTDSQVWFSQGAAVMSSDGRASNILSQLRSGTYSFTSREVVPALASVSRVAEASSIPIRSSTHADQTKWYSTTTALFEWDLPEGVSAVRTLLDDEPDATPSQVYNERLTSLRVPDLDQGTSYFHLQWRDGSGWGSIFHFALNVDTETPYALVVDEQPRLDAANPNATFAISALDDLSGIARYEISVNGGSVEVWNDDDATGVYQSRIDTPGTHMLEVVAFDRAGNSTSSVTSFTVEALDAPQMTEVPERLLVGDALTVRGITYPNAEVLVEVSFNGREPERRVVSADGAGNFVSTAVDPVRDGEYVVSFIARDERGAQSVSTDKFKVVVTQPTLLLFGSIAVNYLTIAITLLGSVVLLILLLWCLWYLVSRMRGRVGKEAREAEATVHHSFTALKNDVEDQLAMLSQVSTQRPLTREEIAVFNTLSSHLDEAEEAILDEIDDIAPATKILPQSIKIKRTR